VTVQQPLFRAVALVLLLFPNVTASQELAESVFNAGVNFGAAERLTELCPEYMFDRQTRRQFDKVAKLQRSAFAFGRQKGRAEITKIMEQQPPDLAEAMACLTATLMFGPNGNTIQGALIENKRIRAQNEAARKKREAQRKAKAAARKDEPPPTGAKEGDLIVDQDDEQPDKLAGRHEMRLRSIERDGETILVGCVPCFNAMTTMAIYQSVPYALNGLTRPRLWRYRVVIDGVARPVRDVEGSPLDPVLNLISEAQKVPGCNAATHDFTNRLARAVTEGACLAW